MVMHMDHSAVLQYWKHNIMHHKGIVFFFAGTTCSVVMNLIRNIITGLDWTGMKWRKITS